MSFSPSSEAFSPPSSGYKKAERSCSTTQGLDSSPGLAPQMPFAFSFQIYCFPSNQRLGHSGPCVYKLQAGTPRLTISEVECECDAKTPSGTYCNSAMLHGSACACILQLAFHWLLVPLQGLHSDFQVI